MLLSFKKIIIQVEEKVKKDKMNLFLLSWNLEKCARMHTDKHVGKMLLEIVQMMYTAMHLLHPGGGWMMECPLNKKGERGYKTLSNPNHPMAIWVRSNLNNYDMASRLAVELGKEFERRYGHPHGSMEHALWLQRQRPQCFHNHSEKAMYGHKNMEEPVEPIPLCMPEKYHHADPVVAYNRYYVAEKIAKENIDGK